MADNNDKPNQSGKPVNGKIPRYLESNFEARMSDISDIYERKSVHTADERVTKYEQKLKSFTPGTGGWISALENVAQAERDRELAEQEAARQINRQYADQISTKMRIENVNARTTTMSGQHRYYSMARRSQELYAPTERLQERIGEIQDQITTRGSILGGRIRGLGEEEPSPGMMAEAQAIGGLEEQAAFYKKLIKVQNREGLSSEKLFGASDVMLERTGRYFEERGIANKVESRDIRSINEERKALAERQRNVFLAQEKYEKGIDSNIPTQELAAFAKELKESTEALNKQQKVVREMEKQGISGPGMGWGDIGKVAALAGRATAFVARGQKQVMVDNYREEVMMRAGFAARGNRIYNRAEESIMGGNMDAMLELTSGALQAAQKDAMGAKMFTNTAEGLAQIGDAAEGIGNVTTAGIQGGKAGLIGGAAVAGGSQAAIELTRAQIKADRLNRGLYGGAEALGTYDARLEEMKQLRAMDSKIMQAVYDQGMTSYNSVAGLGGAGGIQSQLLNTDTLGRMAGVGLTPEKAAQLTAGMRAAGAMTANDALNVVEGAGRAKRKGILGQEEFVGMSAALMGAGGAAGDLEKIMGSAVAAGMDNSKSIGELVSGTLALSKNMSNFGIATTGSSQSLLAKASQDLVAAGIDPNLAANAAASTMMKYSAAQSSREFTLGNVMERAGLRRMFGGASIFQLNRLSEMTVDQHKTLLDAARNPSKANMKKANTLVQQMGLSDVLNPEGEGFDQGQIREIMKLSFTGAGIDKGALGARGVDLDKMVDKMVAGKKLSDKEMAFLSEFGGAGQVIAAGVAGDNPATKDPNTKKTLTGAGVEQTQANFKVKELLDAQGKGPGIEKIFGTLEKTLDGIQKNIGPDAVKKITEDAAKNFNTPILEFKEGSVEFKKAVDKFVKWQEDQSKRVGSTYSRPKYDSPIKEQADAEKRKLNDMTTYDPTFKF